MDQENRSEVGGRGQGARAVVHEMSQTELTAGVLPKFCRASTCNCHRVLYIRHQHVCVCVCVCGMPPTLFIKHKDTGTCLVTNGNDSTNQDSSGGVSNSALHALPPPAEEHRRLAEGPPEESRSG